MKKKLIFALCLLSVAGYTNNVYAQETVDPEDMNNIESETESTIYEKDIPENKKDDYHYVKDEVITDEYKDLSKDKANELVISLESNGFTKTVLKSYIVKTGEVIASIEEKFDSYSEALKYIESLKENEIEVSNVKFVNDTKVEVSSLNETYETLEDAQKALEEFKKEYNENIDEKEIVDNETDEILEENEGTISYVTYAEALAALNAFLNAEENQSREFYFEGSVVGPKEDGTFTETEINEQFESEKEAIEYLANLEKEGYEILDYKFTNDTEKKDGSLNETYETLEDAQKALEEFKKEYNENIDEKEIVDNETDEILEENEGTISYNTYEEALAALNAFLNAEENQSREFYFEGSVVGPKGNGTYTKTDINETFNTKAEAEAFLNGLKEKGYTIINSTFTNDTRTDSKTIDQIYETYEEALAAIKEFKETYNANYAWTLNKVEDETENTNAEFDEIFDNEDDANSYLADKKALESKDVIVTGEVKENAIHGEITNIDVAYATLNEAKAAKEALNTQYNVVENATVEEVPAGTVEEVTVTKNYETQYVVTNSLFFLIKKGNAYYAWTLNEVLPSAQAQFKANLKEIDKQSPLGMRIDSIRFIYGMNSFESENRKPFSFSKDPKTGALLVKMAPGSVSYVAYGKYVPQTKFRLTANVHNISYTYEASGNVLTKGYDYKVNAYGERTVTLESGKLIGEKEIENKGYFVNTIKKDKTHTVNIKARKTITLKKGRLTGKKKIENKGYFVNTVKKNKTHTINISGEKTIELESGLLTADTKENVFEELYSIDVINKLYAINPMGDGIEENPKTGDDGLLAITIGGFSMIGMLASCRYLKKEEDDKITL